MIKVVTLSHNNSIEYTNKLKKRIPSIEVYDSSLHLTPFTISFNNALKTIDNNDWIMVCNNDISLNQQDLDTLNEVSKKLIPGIYSPAVNSPHPQMYKSDNRSVKNVKWIELVCPIIHRHVIQNIGYLDEAMPLGYGVDFDYCYRAQRSGYTSYVIQSVQILHYEHKSQENHKAYKSRASNEMHSYLTEKYGLDWISRLT